jgi:hypothetical protein
MARLIRLLVMIAVLLMPFGMVPAMAAVAHQSSAAGMPMEHCPDQGSGHDTKRGFSECTMACAAALPATDSARPEPLIAVCESGQPPMAQRLHGLHPDTATPPPKHS